jgi:hypothetical protein
MNGRSYGYLVRALNELASLRARCRLKDLQRPLPAKVPVRIKRLWWSRSRCRNGEQTRASTGSTTYRKLDPLVHVDRRIVMMPCMRRAVLPHRFVFRT